MFDTERFILEIQTWECIWNSKYERLFAVLEVKDSTGHGLNELLKNCFQKHGLKYENIGGVSFDGASNMRSPSYHNKELKRDAWISVFNTIYGELYEEVSPEEQNEKVEDLKKKWKNIRDHFKKSRKILPWGSSSKTVKPYVYSEMLDFLIPVIDHKRSDSNTKEEEDSIADLVDDSITSTNSEEGQKRNSGTCLALRSRKAKKKLNLKNKHTFLGNKMLERLSTTKKKEEEDPDKCFLFSLLPQIRMLNSDQKNYLYIEFLQSIQRAKYFQPPNHQSPANSDSNHTSLVEDEIK